MTTGFFHNKTLHNNEAEHAICDINARNLAEIQWLKYLNVAEIWDIWDNLLKYGSIWEDTFWKYGIYWIYGTSGVHGIQTFSQLSCFFFAF